MAKTDTRRVGKENATVEPAESKPVKTRAPIERLTLPSDGGKVQWSLVRESRYDELRAQLTPLPAWLAPASAPAAKADTSALNLALAGSLYDVLAQVESIVAARAFGCSMELAFQNLAFTGDEKRALAEPTARVLDKYLPASVMEKYGDEVMLLLLLVTMTKNKVSQLQTAIAHSRPPSVVTWPGPITKTTEHAQVEEESQDGKL